jgi:hypothetical protein
MANQMVTTLLKLYYRRMCPILISEGTYTFMHVAFRLPKLALSHPLLVLYDRFMATHPSSLPNF